MPTLVKILHVLAVVVVLGNHVMAPVRLKSLAVSGAAQATIIDATTNNGAVLA